MDKYWWGFLFSASDRNYVIESGGEVNMTVGLAIDWHEDLEKKRLADEKFFTEHQGDNMESSR